MGSNISEATLEQPLSRLREIQADLAARRGYSETRFNEAAARLSADLSRAPVHFDDVSPSTGSLPPEILSQADDVKRILGSLGLSGKSGSRLAAQERFAVVTTQQAAMLQASPVTVPEADKQIA